MTTQTATITEFIEQRIAEWEAMASEAMDCEEPTGSSSWWVDGPAVKSGKYWVYATGEKFSHEPIAQHIAAHDPARVLAQCKAYRQIVEDREHLTTVAGHSAVLAHADFTLRALASIWSDSPDYRAEWAL